ncbi:MAG: hypothetical protein ACTSW1_11735 [Candidatus Hodarchaeales archaeon]
MDLKHSDERSARNPNTNRTHVKAAKTIDWFTYANKQVKAK